MNYLAEYQVYIWLFAATVFIVIEALTFNLTTMWFAFGSLIGMLCSIAGFPVLTQLLISLFSSIALILFARPIAVKYLKVGRTKTNSESLIGETGTVIKKIGGLEPGIVKVKGQEWSAEAASGGEIKTGEKVEIVEIRGVKLLVNKKGEI